MAELFATTLDVYLTTGDLLEDAADIETADGRPATRALRAIGSPARIGCDSEEFSQTDAEVAARGIAEAQRRQVRSALEAVLRLRDLLPGRVFLSGLGSFLGRQIVANLARTRGRHNDQPARSVRRQVSDAACAFAVARLSQGIK